MKRNPVNTNLVIQILGRETPPYCMNPECRWHDREIGGREGKYRYEGGRKIMRAPYLSVRFRCQRCRTVFSLSAFTNSYRDKLDDNYEQIFNLRCDSMTKMAIAEYLKCSRETVRRRLRKLERQCVLQSAVRTKELKIRESIAFDGLENFSFSQYNPNNINHATGRESMFIYDWNFSPMNRKGAMNPAQKLQKKRLENKYGRYDPRSIQRASKRVFARLLARADGELILHTDNHYAYRRALRQLRRTHSFTHTITLAKRWRNHSNKLFAINHVDVCSRQRFSSFKRETLSFAKHSIAMQGDFAIFAVDRNYFRPMFEKRQAKDPKAHLDTPAMRVGLTDKALSFAEFFDVRVTKHQIQLNDDELKLFERRDPSSRRPIQPYSGI